MQNHQLYTHTVNPIDNIPYGLMYLEQQLYWQKVAIAEKQKDKRCTHIKHLRTSRYPRFIFLILFAPQIESYMASQYNDHAL